LWQRGKSLKFPEMKKLLFDNRLIFCLRSPMAGYISGKETSLFIAGGLQGSLEGMVKRNVIVTAGLEPHLSKPLPLCLIATFTTCGEFQVVSFALTHRKLCMYPHPATRANTWIHVILPHVRSSHVIYGISQAIR
jgi:hypothetical protein